MEPIRFDYQFNSLNDNHPKSDNVPGLSLDLMNHQKTAIYHAEIIERNEGFRIQWDNHFSNLTRFNKEEVIDPYFQIYCNFGVLACKVGSGKSFVALAIILKKPFLYFERTVSADQNPLCFSFKEINTFNNTVPTNFILVPHNLFSQWKNYIKTYTNLDTNFIGSKKEYVLTYQQICDYYKLNSDIELFKSEEPDEIINQDKLKKLKDALNLLTNNKVYLISTTMWNEFANDWTSKVKKRISRVFIDEVHSIHLPASAKIKTNFTWFITSSIKDIHLHRNNGFIRETIDNYWGLFKQYQDHVVIKNDDSYIDSSIQLPPVIHQKIICRPSVILNIFDGVINQDVKNMLLAEDIQGVVSYLGIEVVNEANIIKVLCSNLEKELDNAKLLYSTKQQMHYATAQSKNESLSKAQDKIKSISDKIENVKKRITESNMDPILHTEIVNPVVTQCCKNKFDIESLTSYYEFKNKSGTQVDCPMCRARLDLTKLVYVGEKKKEEKKVEKNVGYNFEEHTKLENLEQILKNNIPANKRILIFSEHEGNINQISQIFEKSGRTNLSPVKGSISHISNLIEKFNNGEINNLFLNAKHCGSGLNLEKTDFIIIMHKMTEDNIKQIIGRGNRIGRSGPLKVFYLYTKNE